MQKRNGTVISILFTILFVLGTTSSSAQDFSNATRLDPTPSLSITGPIGPSPDLDIPIQAKGMKGTFLPDGKQGFSGIEVRIEGELAAVTDASGRFELPAGIPADVMLEFAVNGRIFYRVGASPGMKTIGPEESIGDGTIYGTVLDQDGIVPGTLAIVTNGEDYAFDLANSLGEYTINGAPTGQVLVIALAELHYPAMNAVELLPEVPYQLDIFLKKAEGLGKLYGRAFIPGVGTLSGVYVNYSRPGGPVREDITNVYGMYELLNIPAGIGHLFAAKVGFHNFNLPYFVLPGFNEQDIMMIPVQLGIVIGQVKTLDQVPIPGALIRLTYQKLSGQFDWMFTYSGDKGEFAFGEIPPGSYIVQSFIPGWHPGTAIGTVFEGSVEEETLYMWPAQKTGTLEGWAVDLEGNPVPHAFGYLVYIGFEKNVSGWCIADEYGRFIVDDVPYGPYAVRIESGAFLPDWAFSDILPNENNDFLKILTPFNPSLSGVLAGTVVDTSGAPQPFAIVGCQAAGIPDLTFKTFADENGNYVFPILPPVVYGAFAYHPAVGFGTGFDQVFMGEVTILNIVLE